MFLLPSTWQQYLLGHFGRTINIQYSISLCLAQVNMCSAYLSVRGISNMVAEAVLALTANDAR